MNEQKRARLVISFTSQDCLTRPGVIGYVDDVHLQEPDGNQPDVSNVTAWSSATTFLNAHFDVFC